MVFNAAVRFESGLDDTGTIWFTWVTFLMSQVGSFIHKLNYPDVIRILIDYVFIKINYAIGFGSSCLVELNRGLSQTILNVNQLTSSSCFGTEFMWWISE